MHVRNCKPRRRIARLVLWALVTGGIICGDGIVIGDARLCLRALPGVSELAQATQ